MEALIQGWQSRSDQRAIFLRCYHYDLVLATVDLLDSEWEHLRPDVRQQRYEDYSLVNEIIH